MRTNTELTNNRISALVACVVKAVEDRTNAQVLMRVVDDRLCLKVVDIRNDAQRAELKDMLDSQFCESLMFVNATKTTLVYALPVVKGVA